MQGGLHIDLWEAVRLTLIRAGVPDSHILTAGIDTYTHPGFFSARREGPSCGRTVNTIMLNATMQARPQNTPEFRVIDSLPPQRQ